jgi:hypothetical protein
LKHLYLSVRVQLLHFLFSKWGESGNLQHCFEFWVESVQRLMNSQALQHWLS